MVTAEELRNWELEECSRLDGLRLSGDFLCELFKKAKDDDARYRTLLDFASRQDNAPDAEPTEEEMPCVAEECAPSLFRVCCEELERAGLLRTRRKEAFYRFPDMSRCGVAIFILGLTYRGRLELARLEREAYQRSWRFRLKEIAWNSLTFVVGAVVSAAIAWLFK